MDLQVYVHGIATFAVTELPTSSKGELLKMVHRANTMFLKYMKENRDSEKTDWPDAILSMKGTNV